MENYYLLFLRHIRKSKSKTNCTCNLLSFLCSKAQDGRLLHVEVYGYEKRYDPDKYYVYILLIERENQPHATNIFRTYKEFCELHQKLCLHFPLAKLHR